MAVPIATLNGTNLPPQFSYKPHIIEKRNSVHRTAGAVITQSAPDQMILGDGVIAWQIEAAYPEEYDTLWDLYNTTSLTLYIFVGYWGESFDVYFSKFDPPDVKARLFSLSGEFQVISQLVDYSPACMHA